MKTLYIIRHAKSSWSSGVKSDFERPLNKRGERDAPVMGAVLKQKNILPYLIIASPANRAKTTAMIIAESILYKEEDLFFIKDLYLASSEEILDILKSVNSTINSLILVGHNPGLSDLINQLSNRHIDNLPTAGIYAIEFDISNWKFLDSTCAKMLFFEYPKGVFNI